MKTAAALAALAFGVTTSHVLSQQPGSTPPATVFESGETQSSLIELFTSEGCSSCPPAEKWLSALKSNPDLWKKIVPVAFHVDYWDGLGWRDRFAKPEFTQRQRRYAFSWPTGAVYTPMLVLNGKEWRGWFNGEAVPRRSEKAGTLSVTLTNGTEVTATFIGTRQRSLKLEVALLGNNLDSDVKRGENRGRKLHHDFAVLQFARIEMTNDGGRWSGTTSLQKEPKVANPGALVAWVKPGDTDPPIQATGGWLKP